MKILRIFMVLTMSWMLQSETLFEVKDNAGNPVLVVNRDGVTIINQDSTITGKALGDTLMTISASSIQARINAGSKGLSRSFTVTSSDARKGDQKVLEVTNAQTVMTDGGSGNDYTDLSASNLFIGLNSGSGDTGEGNVQLGNNSGISSGWRNIFIGDSAGYSPSGNSGSDNVYIGSSSGRDNLTGYNNVFIGHEAGIHNKWGSQNVLIGYRAGWLLTNGHYNTNIGNLSGSHNDTGSYNTCYGYYSGHWTTSGQYNTFIGSDCGMKNDTGSNNTFLGKSSGWYNENGNNNVYMGRNTGYYNVFGSNNTYMGHYAGSGSYGQSVSGNVCIGYYAGASNAASNRLYIDNSSSSDPLIYGQFDTNRIGINDGGPTANLHIKQSGSGEEGLAIENESNTNTWSWEIGYADLGLYYNDTYVGGWDDATGNYSSVSDKRLKKDISMLTEPVLDRLLKLRPAEYRLKHAEKNTAKTIGFIAQEVETVYPELVREREDGYLYLNYDEFGVLAIKAIQEQQNIIDKQNEKIDRLEKMIIELSERIK